MRKALVVGLDSYAYCNELLGCVNDAQKVMNVRERDADGTVIFGVKLLTTTANNDVVSRVELKDQIFKGDNEICTIQFAGHGLLGGRFVGADQFGNQFTSRNIAPRNRGF